MAETFTGTVQELADKLTCDYSVVAGFMKLMVALGYAKESGKKGTGKRPAQMYEIPMTFTCELKPVSIVIKPRKKKEIVVDVHIGENEEGKAEVTSVELKETEVEVKMPEVVETPVEVIAEAA